MHTFSQMGYLNWRPHGYAREKDWGGRKGREASHSLPGIMSAPPPHPRRKPGKEDQAENRLRNSGANPPSFLRTFPKDRGTAPLGSWLMGKQGTR